MRYYQIRIHENSSLEDVLEDMAIKGWIMIRNVVRPKELSLENYKRFRAEIRAKLLDCLEKRDLCGSESTCDDVIEALSYFTGGSTGQSLPSGSIFLLRIDENTDHFLENLSLQVLSKIRSIIEAEKATRARIILQMVFACVLADVLYEAPLCGQYDFCANSQTLAGAIAKSY